MAKKKTRKKVVKNPKPKLDTTFNCPVCGHKSTVECKLDRKKSEGILECVNCGERYIGKLKRITAAIDVYYQWLDHRRTDKEREEKEEENKKLEKNEEEGEEDEFNDESPKKYLKDKDDDEQSN